MENIFVRSKLGYEDFKKYLYYRHYFENKTFFPIRIILSLAVAAGAAIIANDKIISFLVVLIFCMAVFLLFPMWQIGFRYKRIYTRNRSGAFSQSQDFEFTDKFIGFKSEYEEQYDYTEYSKLRKITGTKDLYIINFAAKQDAILAKSCIDDNKKEALNELLKEKMKNNFHEIKKI